MIAFAPIYAINYNMIYLQIYAITFILMCVIGYFCWRYFQQIKAYFQKTEEQIDPTSMLVDKIIAEKLSDDIISPNEITIICNYIQSIGIKDLSLLQQTENIERFQYRCLIHELNNGNIEQHMFEIDSFVAKKDERGVASFYATLYEWRKDNYGLYHGFRFKPFKGIGYTIGALKPLSLGNDSLKAIDDIKVTITNKRVVLEGNKKCIVFTPRTILDVETFSNGFMIKRTSGKPVFIKTNFRTKEQSAFLNLAFCKITNTEN